MRIGDKALDKPTFGDVYPKLEPGQYASEVVYIHPRHIFYTAKFTFLPSGMNFTESFFLGGRRGRE